MCEVQTHRIYPACVRVRPSVREEAQKEKLYLLRQRGQEIKTFLHTKLINQCLNTL